jgi:hypothetical protein
MTEAVQQFQVNIVHAQATNEQCINERNHAEQLKSEVQYACIRLAS